MASLSYGDFRPLRKGESGYSPTARRYVSPSTGEILPVRQFQKRAEGSALNQKAKQVEQRRVEKRKAPGAGAQKQKQKPVAPAPKTPPIAKRNLGQYVRHKRNEKGDIIRTRVNARNEESLSKQIDRTGDNRRIIFHLINQRTGEEVRAVPNKGVTAADLKQEIAQGLAQGKTQKEATRDALSNLFTFYGVDPVTGIRTSDELDGAPDDISNFLMYAE